MVKNYIFILKEGNKIFSKMYNKVRNDQKATFDCTVGS